MWEYEEAALTIVSLQWLCFPQNEPLQGGGNEGERAHDAKKERWRDVGGKVGVCLSGKVL